MIASLLYVLLAIFGLSILIFLHELGHYFMARRVGMRVETFAIGFGRPIYSWEHDGVKWQIGWLLFGGYVKIAGQDNDDKRDPYTIPDGFFGKPPIDRIKVAVMGPLVNLAVALLLFGVIWATGGREKGFSDFTHKLGWVDPKSELYANGVRPGDEILSYNNSAFESAKDHLYVPMTSSGEIDIKGLKVDYTTGQKTPFEQKVKSYPHPFARQKGIMTTGILSSANYMIYDRSLQGHENPLPEGSPMAESGIQYGDRIIWVDGELIFSLQQLNHVLNDDRVLLTILRDGKTLQVRVPRVIAQEIKMDAEFKEEITDWQYEAELNNVKLQKLYVIPYNLTNDGVVENEMKFIDKENQLESFPQNVYSASEMPLQPKDRIIAIDGMPIKTSYQLLKNLQNRHINIIVETGLKTSSEISWQKADVDFDREINWNDVRTIANSIGTDHPIAKTGNYRLLNPIAPKMRSDFLLAPEKQAQAAVEMQEQKRQLESIEDPEQRSHALALLQAREKERILGISVQDRKVNFNPSPWAQFESVFSEIWRTLVALVSGSLNPKWIAGPIGIVQVVHDNWMLGIKEAIFWLGAISLNLGILNLLPIPVLDGGTIMLSLFEMVTGRKLHPKTLEKLILPFAVLLIALFVFLTYQDLSRIFSSFLR